MKRIIPVFLLLFLTSSAIHSAEKNYVYMPAGADFIIYGRGSETFIINRSKIGDKEFNLTINRLSSGQRINSAADDPAGLAVAEKMDSMLEGIMRESMNDADMRNFYSFVESSIASDQEIVRRIRELTVRAAGGILDPEDRELIQSEVGQLLSQVDMNAKFSQLNKIQVIPELTSQRLRIDKINVVRDPEGAMEVADSALKMLVLRRVMQGVKSNILTFRIEGKSYYYLNLVAAESRIVDQDMAEGISELAKQGVLMKTRYGVLLRGR